MELNYIKINYFDTIDITNNTLVLCDIDNTVLRFKLDFDYFYEKTRKYLIEINDYVDEKDIVFMAQQEFNKYKNETTPFHTDKKGFDIMLDKINKTNSKLIFITARSANFKKITYTELNQIGIDYKMFDIHFTYDYKISKASYINQYIDLTNYDSVYFIDDHDITVKNVKKKFPQITCFLFKCID